jgi:hypothetical protein
MPRSPLIVPEDDVYLVLDDFGRLGRAWRETDEAAASRATLVRIYSRGNTKIPSASLPSIRLRAGHVTRLQNADELRRYARLVVVES